MQHTYAWFARDVFSWQFIYLFFIFPPIIIVYQQLVYYGIIVLLGLLVVGYLLRERSVELTRSFVVIVSFYTLFLLYASLSLLWSPSLQHSLFELLRLSTLSVLLIVVPALFVRDAADMERMMRVLLYGSLFVGGLLVLGFVHPAYHRPYQIAGYSSHITPGRIVGMGLPVAAYYLLYQTDRTARLAAGIAIAILGTAIVVSGSRGPLVAAIGAGVLVVSHFVVRNVDLRTDFWQIVGVSAICVPVVLVLADQLPTLDRIVPILQGNLDSSSRARLEFYVVAVDMWRDAPVLGNGLAAFNAAIGIYPHNFVLEILSGLGLVGLLLFLAVLLHSVRSITSGSLPGRQKALLGSFLLYAIINASVSFSLSRQRPLFFVVGLSAALFVHRSVSSRDELTDGRPGHTTNSIPESRNL